VAETVGVADPLSLGVGDELGVGVPHGAAPATPGSAVSRPTGAGEATSDPDGSGAGVQLLTGVGGAAGCRERCPATGTLGVVPVAITSAPTLPRW